MFAKIPVSLGGACAAAALSGLMVGPWAGYAVAEQRARMVSRIQDNSFLVEEAYNQEAGVVQHIGTAFYQHPGGRSAGERRLELAVTQEWPLCGRRHQFSYTVPFVWSRETGRERSGPGDVMFHYRFQAWFDERSLWALAPRASLILPTGNSERGLGENSFGFQFNVPFSATLADRWSAHLNAGVTVLPNAASLGGRVAQHGNLGGSVICAIGPELHVLVEWVGLWAETERAESSTRHEFISLLSPGVRRAFDLRGDAQLVLGVAAPVGLTATAPQWGVFLYVSVEHSFRSRAVSKKV